MAKFQVSYKRCMSTIGQEIETYRKVVLEFDKQPKRNDFQEIEQQLEQTFLGQHKKHLKNLLSISFKVKEVLPIR